MGDAYLKWVVSCAVILGLIGVGISLGLGRTDYAVGIGAGAAIAILNLWAIKRMTHRMLAAGKTGSTAGLFLIKLSILGGVLWACIRFLPLDPLGFALGLSVVVLAVPLGTMFGPMPNADDKNDGAAVGTE